MKKRRLLRNAALVALSGVLVGGAALAFTACKDSEYTISVNIFCSNADAITNKAICDRWAEEYSETHADELGGNKITVNFQPTTDQAKYFEDLDRNLGSGSFADVIYVSPSRVVSFARQGHLLNLTDYITADEELVAQASGIWSDSLAFYSTKGSLRDMTYVGGVAYDEASGNFIDPEDANKATANIYGLPKDYSNFGLGYNSNYFTEQFKKAYTTLKPSSGGSERSVQGHIYDTNKSVAGVTYTGTNSVGGAGALARTSSITYAVDSDSIKDGYTNPYTGEKMTFKAGDEAPFIAVGVPLRYRPFNYYLYTSYGQAIAAGDPVAATCEYYTKGEGYIVTMPGFPGETFDIAEELPDAKNAINSAETPYDKETAYMTFTWTEFSALNWACAYMLNSFAWDSADGVKTIGGGDEKKGNSVKDYSAWFTGQGGKYTGAGGNANDKNEVGDFSNFYGGEQYEQGTFGANGYVLPWAYSNDAAYIDSTYTKCLNTKQGTTEIAKKGTNGWEWTKDINSSTSVHDFIGNEYETVAKTNLDGTTRDAQVQYGVNSENFVEAYAAFQDYCAIWNAHDGQAGDVKTAASSDKSFNGQNTFVGGYSFFYGVGTWDVSEYQEVDKDTLTVGVMPTAVSNRLSLYSQTRAADYSGITTYHNTATEKGTGNAANNDYAYDSDEKGLKIYSQEEIYENQLLRQDKWGGRMDSVGYAVNADVAENGPEWKAAAAVSLVLALTIDEEAQKTLTYGGAQIPNVVSMCEDYLNGTGSFADMITPESEDWDEYYKLAKEMASAAQSQSTKTVAEFLNGKKINGKDVAYDTQYANTQLVNFTNAATSNTKIAYSMRVLKMIGYTRADRDIVIRMQYGLNAAKDQLLYAKGNSWITNIDATAQYAAFFAYRNQATLNNEYKMLDRLNAGTLVATVPKAYDAKANMIMTPAVYLVRQALTSQNNLDEG